MLLLWPCNVDLDLIRSHQQSLGNIGHTVVSCVRVPIQASPWSLWDSWAEPDLNARERSGHKPIPSFVPPGIGYYAILAAYCVICGCDMYVGQTRSHTVDHK